MPPSALPPGGGSPQVGGGAGVGGGSFPPSQNPSGTPNYGKLPRPSGAGWFPQPGGPRLYDPPPDEMAPPGGTWVILAGGGRAWIEGGKPLPFGSTPVSSSASFSTVGSGTQPSVRNLSFAATTKELGTPALLGRPQFFATWAKDLRDWTEIDDYSMCVNNHYTPIIGRLEAFGTQSVGNSQWTYNETPGGTKYLGGTSQGGWALLPAEIGMEDAPGFAPKGITLTTPYLMTIPGTYFGSGIPSTVYGAPTTGWRWTADSSGNLLYEQLSSTAVATNGFRLQPNVSVQGRVTTNMIAGLYDSIGGFWGSLTPATLIAARTWTLPDSTGTISLTELGAAIDAMRAFMPKPQAPPTFRAGANIALTPYLGGYTISAFFTPPPSASPNASYMTLDSVPFNAMQRQFFPDRSVFTVNDAGPSQPYFFGMNPAGGDLTGAYPSPTVIWNRDQKVLADMIFGN